MLHTLDLLHLTDKIYPKDLATEPVTTGLQGNSLVIVGILFLSLIVAS